VHTSEVRNNTATSDGRYANGGGFSLASAHLVVSESLLGGNLADARSTEGTATGGAIFTFSTSRLTVEQTVLQNNAAQGGQESAGGAVHILVDGDAEVVRSTFEGNSAGGPKHSFGGAIRTVLATIRIRDSEFRASRVFGGNGGAITVEGGSAMLSNVSLVRNRAVASKGSGNGNGGALHVGGGVVRLDGCRLHDNVAESLNGAMGSDGGGVWVWSGDVRIARSTLRGNRIGGVGFDQAAWSAYCGAHVSVDGGDVVIDGCSVTDDGDGEEASLENAGTFLLMAKQRSLALHNSSFSCATPGRGLLLLWPGNAAELQLAIRGCTVSNLPIMVADQPKITIGIVNSKFTPALDPAVPTLQPNNNNPPDPDPHCGAEIAGAPLCDPRAACERAPSGGVQCACTGQGLRDKAGTFPTESSARKRRPSRCYCSRKPLRSRCPSRATAAQPCRLWSGREARAG
jgi:hypothetical protein